MPQALLYPSCQVRVYKSPHPCMVGEDERLEGWGQQARLLLSRLPGGEKQKHILGTPTECQALAHGAQGGTPKPWNTRSSLARLSTEGGGGDPPGPLGWGQELTCPVRSQSRT